MNEDLRAIERKIAELDRRHWSVPASPIQKLAKTKEETSELYEAAGYFERKPCAAEREAFADELADVAMTLFATSSRLGVSLTRQIEKKLERVERRIAGEDSKPMRPTPWLCRSCWENGAQHGCPYCGGSEIVYPKSNGDPPDGY